MYGLKSIYWTFIIGYIRSFQPRTVIIIFNIVVTVCLYVNMLIQFYEKLLEASYTLKIGFNPYKWTYVVFILIR